MACSNGKLDILQWARENVHGISPQVWSRRKSTLMEMDQTLEIRDSQFLGIVTSVDFIRKGIRRLPQHKHKQENASLEKCVLNFDVHAI